MKNINLNISNQTIQNIKSQVGSKTAEELKQDAQNQNLYMKKIALDYIEQVQKILNRLNLARQEIERVRKHRQNIREKVQNEQQVSKDQITKYEESRDNLYLKFQTEYNFIDFFKKSLIFNDQILQIITGKKTLITVVVQGDNSPVVVEMTIEQLLQGKYGTTIKQDISSRGQITARLSFDTEKIKSNINNTIHRDNIITGTSLDRLNQAYNSGLNTFKKYGSIYAFWKPTRAQHWFKMRVTGKQGDFNQAYAYFFYKGGFNKNIFTDILYDNLNIFFTEGVGKIDSVSGLYANDIQFVENNYGYAVKSLDASIPGYYQMIVLARKILNGKIASVDKLKEESLKKQYKNGIVDQKYRKGLRNKIEQVFSDIPQEMTITKNFP